MIGLAQLLSAMPKRQMRANSASHHGAVGTGLNVETSNKAPRHIQVRQPTAISVI